jgi:hypothetical protein
MVHLPFRVASLCTEHIRTAGRTLPILLLPRDWKRARVMRSSVGHAFSVTCSARLDSGASDGALPPGRDHFFQRGLYEFIMCHGECFIQLVYDLADGHHIPIHRV